MAFYSRSPAEFAATYFVVAPVEIQPLSWSHWPTSAPLFLGDFPGLVRCAPLHLIGRSSTEEPLLGALLAAAQQELPQVFALQNQATSAVVGLAAWNWHPVWPDTVLVDCYCHPAYWRHAGDLLQALPLPNVRRVAYVDVGNAAKAELFAQTGFHPVATLPNWIAADPFQSAWVDVQVVAQSL
jgi:hypothetical protein